MAAVSFTNLRIWDGVANGYLEGADSLRIEAGRITWIGARADLADPQARDMSGQALIPGLIDAHVHMCLDPAIEDAALQGREDAATLIALLDARAAAMRRAGITTARDVGGGAWAELALRDRIAAGAVDGPRLLCSGQPITSPAGHCHFWGGEAADLEAALDVLERQISHHVDLIKVMATGGNLTRGTQPVAAQFDTPTLCGIVDAARGHGRPVAAHCHGTAGIRNAATAGVSTIEHCSWLGGNGWHADYDAEVAARIAANGIAVSPTINSGWARNLTRADYVQRIRDNFARMRAAGIRLIASTDAGIPGVYHDDLPRALPVFARYADLTPVQVLRCATSDAAAGLGLGDSVGRIDVGATADLLFIDGDPLADLAALTRPSLVITRGRLPDA